MQCSGDSLQVTGRLCQSHLELYKSHTVPGVHFGDGGLAALEAQHSFLGRKADPQRRLGHYARLRGVVDALEDPPLNSWVPSGAYVTLGRQQVLFRRTEVL